MTDYECPYADRCLSFTAEMYICHNKDAAEMQCQIYHEFMEGETDEKRTNSD